MASTKENPLAEIEIEKLVYGGDGLARLVSCRYLKSTA
jgi:hypothetical protein